MSKTEQIDKCMNIALNHASSDAEAVTAFKTARRLHIKLGNSSNVPVNNTSEYVDTYKLPKSEPADSISFLNQVSHWAYHRDVLIDITASGSVMDMRISLDFKGSKDSVKALIRKINTERDPSVQEAQKQEAKTYKREKASSEKSSKSIDELREILARLKRERDILEAQRNNSSTSKVVNEEGLTIMHWVVIYIGIILAMIVFSF